MTRHRGRCYFILWGRIFSWILLYKHFYDFACSVVNNNKARNMYASHIPLWTLLIVRFRTDISDGYKFYDFAHVRSAKLAYIYLAPLHLHVFRSLFVQAKTEAGTEMGKLNQGKGCYTEIGETDYHPRWKVAGQEDGTSPCKHDTGNWSLTPQSGTPFTAKKQQWWSEEKTLSF